MKYYLSTIADVSFKVVGESEEISYEPNTLPVANKYGLGLELAEFCISENIEDKFDAVISHFEKNLLNAKYVVLHAPYNELMPHAVDKLVAKAAKDRYEWTLKLCNIYGIKKIVVHANYVESLYFPEWFIAKQIEFWKEFVKNCPEDFTICIENVMESKPSLIGDIVRGVNDKRLRMCLDVGHANLMEKKPKEWLMECADIIDHYHLHNIDGPVLGKRPSAGDKHAALGKGNIDMKEFLTLAEELTPNASASVESCDIEESCEWLLENGFI